MTFSETAAESRLINYTSTVCRFLLFSAGLGNIIQEVIEQQASIYNTMKIVSNMMKFDEQVSYSQVNKLYRVYLYIP